MGSVDQGWFEPKSPTQLVGAAFRACFAKSAAALITGAAILVPATALTLVVVYLLGKSELLDTFQAMQTGQVRPDQVDWKGVLTDLLPVIGCGVAAAVVSALSQFAAAAAVARMLAERALGREYGPASAWDFVLGRAGRLIGAAIVQTVVFMGGYMVAYIPIAMLTAVIGLATGQIKPGQPGAQPSPLLQLPMVLILGAAMAALATYLASMPSAVAVENQGAIGAAFRSFRLVSGSFRGAFWAMVLGSIIAIAPTVVLQIAARFAFADSLRGALGPVIGTLAAFAPGVLLGLIAGPLMYSLQATIYFDLRSRRLEEDFTAYELAMDLGGDLPEGVQDSAVGDASSRSAGSGEGGSPTTSDIS